MGSETNKPALPVLNADQVMRDMNDDGEIYREIAQVFLEDALVQRARLTAAGGDRDAAVAALHEVANSLGIIGASRGEQVVRLAEQRLLGGAAEDAIGATVLTAIAALDEAQQALQSWLYGSADPGMPEAS